MNEDQAADMFDGLASAPRLRVLRELVKAGPDGLSAGAISDRLGVSPSSLSFHLSTMTERGLVTQEKQSRSRIYRVDFDTLGNVMRFLMEDCCQNNPTLVACCSPKTSSC